MRLPCRDKNLYRVIHWHSYFVQMRYKQLVYSKIIERTTLLHDFEYRVFKQQFGCGSYRWLVYITTLVTRGILVTRLHCGTPELHLSAFYIVSFVRNKLYNVDWREWWTSTQNINISYSSNRCTKGCQMVRYMLW